jgi:hypothetical protein
MKKLLAIVCLLNANLALSRAQAVPEPIEELKGDGIVTSVVLVAKENFAESDLTKLASEYMARYHSFRLIQVGFYTEERTAWDFRGKSVDHFSYEYWKQEYEKRMSSGLAREAILLAYGNSGTLRIRDRNQQIKEITIVGSNVFHPVLDGLGLNVLHVGFSGQGQPSKLTAHFYLTIPRRITAHEAERRAKSFFDKTKILDVTLNIREARMVHIRRLLSLVESFYRGKTCSYAQRHGEVCAVLVYAREREHLLSKLTRNRSISVRGPASDVTIRLDA